MGFMIHKLDENDVFHNQKIDSCIQVDIEGDADLVSTRLLAGQVYSNPGVAIVE
ncbi:hypothetical protein LINPERHAP1_LOCUS38091 [Linum perenne]